jgi:hypothetical protein
MQITRNDDVVLEPIPTIGLTGSSEDITALAEKTREIMLAALQELSNRRSETTPILPKK